MTAPHLGLASAWSWHGSRHPQSPPPPSTSCTIVSIDLDKLLQARAEAAADRGPLLPLAIVGNQAVLLGRSMQGLLDLALVECAGSYPGAQRPARGAECGPALTWRTSRDMTASAGGQAAQLRARGRLSKGSPRTGGMLVTGHGLETCWP
jgi:hypothetical protein